MDVPVTYDVFPNITLTPPPEIVVIEEIATGTLIVIVIGIVLTIAFLFGLAILIDYRQQKLGKLASPTRPRTILESILPVLANKVEDREKLEESFQPSSSYPSKVEV